MADWGQRVKDKDRDNAIRVIEAAAARGQIIDADRLKRIQEVKAAGTVGEIDMITRGLAAPEPVSTAPPAPPLPPGVSPPAPPVNPTFQPYSPPTTPPVTEPDVDLTPPPTVQYGEPLTPSTGSPISVGQPIIRKSGGAGKFVLLFVLIALAGVAVPVIFVIMALVGTGQDGIDGIPGGGTADVFSTEGLTDLADALEDETGSSEVFSATLYPTSAVLEVPAESSGKRMFRYYWNGELEQQAKGSASNTARLDLRDIDIEVVQDLRAKIRSKVEDSTADTNYVIAHAPGPTDEGASLFAYASNDFSEGGYLAADLDGNVIRTTTW